jgi:hypothetical protein
MNIEKCPYCETQLVDRKLGTTNNFTCSKCDYAMTIYYNLAFDALIVFKDKAWRIKHTEPNQFEVVGGYYNPIAFGFESLPYAIDYVFKLIRNTDLE